MHRNIKKCTISLALCIELSQAGFTFIGLEVSHLQIKRLKELRVNHHLTQNHIAQLLNIRQNVYSRYETGYRTLPIEFLIILADFYKTSTDYILNRTNTQ